jgi:hypothetical protein
MEREVPPMLDDRDLALLQRLAAAAHGTADGTTLAEALGLPHERAATHLWHLQDEGCTNMHLAGTRATWTITETGRAHLPTAS